MTSSAAPKALDDYFQSFSAYLQSGESHHLSAVFPDAEDMSMAGVYRNGFLRGCTEALRASYPAIDALVGEAYFDFLAKDYIKLHPPQRSTFTTYGEQFPSFLEQKRAQHQLGYLADFARLDQAWLRAYFAQDSNLLGEEDIEAWQNAGNSIENLNVCLPKSAQLLKLKHQVSSLWLVLKEDETPPVNTCINSDNEDIIVWRDAQDQVKIRILKPAELAFLSPICKGATLARAAEAALTLDSHFQMIDYFSELLNTDLLAILTNSKP